MPTSGTTDFVEVGDPGNSSDNNSADGATGEVDYSYAIAAGDVTVQDYCNFLNAVAAGSDQYNIYNSAMSDMINTSNAAGAGGIEQTGSAGDYHYLVQGHISGSDPVTQVTWLDAARFCNWMQNGSPAGTGEGLGTTETGAYTLNGELSTTGTEVRNSAAGFALPSLDEWYKAAYYNGAGGYYTYATQSNSMPSNVLGGGSNTANFALNGITYCATGGTVLFSGSNYLTPIGAFAGSASYYGTYDQNGNVDNLTEELYGSNAFVAGGSWYEDQNALVAGQAGNTFYGQPLSYVGFRLVELDSVPEPDCSLLSLVAGAALLVLRRRRWFGGPLA